MTLINFFYLAPLGSILALLFSAYLAISVLKKERGTEIMQEIANAVKEGAKAYLRQQYSVVAIFFLVVFGILFWLSIKGYLVMFVPFAF